MKALATAAQELQVAILSSPACGKAGIEAAAAPARGASPLASIPGASPGPGGSAQPITAVTHLCRLQQRCGIPTAEGAGWPPCCPAADAPDGGSG